MTNARSRRGSLASQEHWFQKNFHSTDSNRHSTVFLTVKCLSVVTLSEAICNDTDGPWPLSESPYLSPKVAVRK